MIFIESTKTEITKKSVPVRLEQLANLETLNESDICSHMAIIDFIDFETTIYGEDLVKELKAFILEKGNNRLKQLLDFSQKSA
jgi:hypothetical protein